MCVITLKYVRDKIVDRLLKHTKGKHNYYSQENFKKHKLALTSAFEMNMESPGVWKIVHDNDEYHIKKINIQKCCNLICQYCDICFHQYTCTCQNYFIHSVICKHIHYVVFRNYVNQEQNLMSQNSSDSKINTGSDITNAQSASNQCLNFFSNNDKNACGYDRKEKILKVISDLQMLVYNQDLNQLSDSVFQQCMSNLQNSKQLLQLPSTSKSEPIESFKDTQQASTSKNILPQNRFFSTQKKKKTIGKEMKNPNKDENHEISNILKGINVKIISNDPSFDHSYI